MKKRIHVNQHNIRKNKKHGTNLPVITVKTYKSNTYGHEVEISGPSKVIYRPVWIETESEVTVIVNGGNYAKETNDTNEEAVRVQDLQ
jgi:hypothetical protein